MIFYLLEYRLHEMSHSIFRLAEHLPFQQTVVFQEGQEEEVEAVRRDKKTTLTPWLDQNTSHEEVHQYLYYDIPEQCFSQAKPLDKEKEIPEHQWPNLALTARIIQLETSPSSHCCNIFWGPTHNRWVTPIPHLGMLRRQWGCWTMSSNGGKV